jgi:hypothetical protein
MTPTTTNYDADVMTVLIKKYQNVSQRSKHPMPKLAEPHSLAGLGFLIAQFLKILS